jgi:outer membrane immunogenic protein
MLFAAGGLAIGDVKAWDALFTTSGRETLAGWTIGGGVEAKITPNWSVRAEYLHVDFGDHGIFSATPPITEHVTTRADIVRVGLNYHFDFAPPPMPFITKY